MKRMTTAFIATLFALSGTTAYSQSSEPNDAQIAGIVVAANTVDVNEGKLAEKMSRDKEVKAFAKQMVTDFAIWLPYRKP